MVLPADASAPAIAAGADALARRGRPQAYLAASLRGRRVDGARRARLGGVSGSWSGRRRPSISTAVGRAPSRATSTWSPATSRPPSAGAGRRCSRATRSSGARPRGSIPRSLRVGVLVQPLLAFAFGGTARVDRDGDEVRVTVARGGPHRVVAGDGASTVVVSADRHVDGDTDVPPGVAARRRCAGARRAAGDRRRRDRVGSDRRADRPAAGGAGCGAQAVRAGRRRSFRRRRCRPTPQASPPSWRGSAGALADDLVLPWALGARSVVDAPPIAVDDVPAAIAEIHARAAELVAAAGGAARRDLAATAIA